MLFYITYLNSVLFPKKGGCFFILKFEVIKNLKPNKDLTDTLKEFKYKVKLGKIKTIIHSNLKVITPNDK